jgi:hypothetical protein
MQQKDKQHLLKMVNDDHLAGAMSTAEMGKSLAEMMSR